jgi:hypothetical protein
LDNFILAVIMSAAVVVRVDRRKDRQGELVVLVVVQMVARMALVPVLMAWPTLVAVAVVDKTIRLRQLVVPVAPALLLSNTDTQLNIQQKI